MPFQDVVSWCRARWPEMSNAVDDDLEVLIESESYLLRIQNIPVDEREGKDVADLAMLSEVQYYLSY